VSTAKNLRIKAVISLTGWATLSFSINFCSTEIYTCEISGSRGGGYENDSLLGLAPCGIVNVNRRFRGVYWWRRKYAPLKHQSVSTRLHGAISQKAAIFEFRTCFLVCLCFIVASGLSAMPLWHFISTPIVLSRILCVLGIPQAPCRQQTEVWQKRPELCIF
jgi:hypothetical protein